MLELRNIGKRFGDTVAVDRVDLTVTNEVVAILGPSGCGKSTLLRMTAGLETPDQGVITWDGTDLNDVPTHLRGFGLVFQGFALFPNRTVGRNVAFGLEMQNVERGEIDRRVDEVLDWVDLADKRHRPIEGLSGGEKQRVALARTLAPEPQLVMFDEPLGSLDRLLRDRLAHEIRDLMDSTGTPAIYVTHDHEEAETVADRIALMRNGRIVQIGTARELRTAPVDAWVTEFMGVK